MGQGPGDLKELMTDERLLAWGRSVGIDLRDREQLLDAAAVGLTVLLWRNTHLENVHAGCDRDAGDMSDSELDALVDAEDQALDEHITSYQHVADPAELDRLERFLQFRRRGAGIPDDIMMRANCATVVAVRTALEAVVTGEMTEPGSRSSRGPDDTPAFLLRVIGLLDDPDRLITVGAGELTALDLLGHSGWDLYVEELYCEKPLRTLAVADLVGDRQALWYVALSGASYGSGWFPNRPWGAAVDELERLVRTGGETHFSPRAAAWPVDTPGFWAALRSEPARLNALQARWVMLSKLDALMDTIARRNAEELGMDPDNQFSSFLATF